MNEREFLNLIIEDYRIELSKSDQVSERVARMVTMFGILGGIFFYLSSLDHLPANEPYEYFYYISMLLAFWFFSRAIYHLAMAFKHGKYEYLDLYEWQEWRQSYRNDLIKMNNYTDQQIDEIISNTFMKSACQELLSSHKVNEEMNDRRFWSLERSIYNATIMFILIIIEAICKLVLMFTG